MPKYQVEMHYPDGSSEILDDYGTTDYDTYEAADEAGLYAVSCAHQGAEILHMSNPGDYDEDDADGTYYEVIEVDE